jgi:hypothetical protein
MKNTLNVNHNEENFKNVNHTKDNFKSESQ